jgi:hypothetical protein
MLAMAQFLHTKTEPKLVSNEANPIWPSPDLLQYYKPWRLLPGDDEKLKEQIADAEAIVDREVREFNEVGLTSPEVYLSGFH